jgi:hypothetical protein
MSSYGANNIAGRAFCVRGFGAPILSYSSASLGNFTRGFEYGRQRNPQVQAVRGTKPLATFYAAAYQKHSPESHVLGYRRLGGFSPIAAKTAS